MLDVATIPDLLRLLVIPFFAYVAWRDIKTRRVPNHLWIPLAILAVVLFVWETYTVLTGDITELERQQYYIQATISVGFLIPLSYLFWRMGGFGGADAKAFIIIAVLFPTYPIYHLPGIAGFLGLFPGATSSAEFLPVVQATVGVFSITILSNTVIVGIFYPVVLAGKNALTGWVSPGMFIAKPVTWDETTEEYGTLLDFPDRGLTDSFTWTGFKEYFAWRSLDLDALRMYLQWRGITLEELRDDPETYRDPASLPEEPNPAGDGSMAASESILTDGGQQADSEDEAGEEGGNDGSDESNGSNGSDGESELEDPWGAEAFLEDIPGTAYGTSPEKLREGLDMLVEEDVVWISPGIPFIVPLFVGLVLAFTYGDILFAVLNAFGLVQ